MRTFFQNIYFALSKYTYSLSKNRTETPFFFLFNLFALQTFPWWEKKKLDKTMTKPFMKDYYIKAQGYQKDQLFILPKD